MKSRRWQPKDLVETPSYAELSGGLTRYALAGPAEGPAVLLVPGMSYPMDVFDPLSTHLATGGFRVLRYDLYGRGLSEFRGGPLNPEALAQQAVELMDSLGFGPSVHLVSLSNSDLLLTRLAVAHPQRARSLAWIAPTGFDARTMERHFSDGQVFSWVAKLGAWYMRRVCAQRMAEHRAKLDAEAQPASDAIYAFSIRSVKESPAFGAAFVDHLLHMPRLAQVEADLEALAEGLPPLLMLHFGREADASDEGLGCVREHLGEATERFIDGGTHMGLIECPEAVNQEVEAFLQSLD